VETRASHGLELGVSDCLWLNDLGHLESVLRPEFVNGEWA
jgi:hypothetical protein